MRKLSVTVYDKLVACLCFQGHSSSTITTSMRDRDKKIGHRRVDKSGIVSYKKVSDTLSATTF